MPFLLVPAEKSSTEAMDNNRGDQDFAREVLITAVVIRIGLL